MNTDRSSSPETPTAAESTVVVGGSGAVGRMLADLLGGDGAPVTVVDLSPEHGIAGDITRPNEPLRQALSTATTVILAVPEQVARRADLTAMMPDALLVETLSVKSRFAAAVPHGGPAVGINPMFAPSLGMAGRPVAAVVHRPSATVETFLSRLERWGASVVVVDADKHDRLAAATQALTHAGILSLGYALASLDLSIDDIAALAPPPHATSLALLARVAGGEPEVYWDVQAGNPHAAAARAALTHAAATLEDTVTGGSDEEFARYVSQAGSALGDRADSYSLLCAELFGIVRGSDGRRGEGHR